MESNLQGILPTRSQFFLEKLSLWIQVFEEVDAIHLKDIGQIELSTQESGWTTMKWTKVNNDEVNKGEQRWSEQIEPTKLPPSGYHRLPSLPPPTNCLVVRLRDGEPNNGSASRLVVNSPQIQSFAVLADQVPFGKVVVFMFHL